MELVSWALIWNIDYWYNTVLFRTTYWESRLSMLKQLWRVFSVTRNSKINYGISSNNDIIFAYNLARFIHAVFHSKCCDVSLSLQRLYLWEILISIVEGKYTIPWSLVKDNEYIIFCKLQEIFYFYFCSITLFWKYWHNF